MRHFAANHSPYSSSFRSRTGRTKFASDVLIFGRFLLASLTFIVNCCQYPYIKTALPLSWKGGPAALSVSGASFLRV